MPYLFITALIYRNFMAVIMKKYGKKSKILAFFLMISFVILWLLILYYFYNLDSIHSRKIFSVLLLISPIIIIMFDRPTVFLEIANALLDTIGYIIVLIYEQIDKLFKSRKAEPKYKRQLQRRDKIKKWLHR